MGILSWILLGLVAGALAKFIMPGKDPGGFIVTILIGVAGAVLGGFLSRFLGGSGSIESFDLGSIFIATIGAFLLLLIYKLVMKNKNKA
ncbi:GlsB/YeaQ/YmgE family stress response membrane protein [Haloferula sp. BvORR071]|uniref:GlsB/YeaQ/YmgE family stress response membrane protein n=1 Tax=Haloferula sp. BvORR071 TaxID=1396141 RepID=UPI00055214B3|nr:GlsB/YeaQ/YmgE family stress response membrane protein [Haloferula sp. BvORR071]